jgi:spore maturation protein CgeB
MKILFVGPLNHGSTSLQRLHALENIGHSLSVINSAPAWLMQNKQPFLYYRIINKIFGPPDLGLVNRQIKKFISQDKIDILWLEKGLEIKPDTLRDIKQYSPNTTIVGYSVDDMGSRHNQSKNFLACLPHYDLYCTTKTYNVPELSHLGCPKVIFSGNAYDPETHRPVEITSPQKEEFHGSVGFIGTYERPRAESMYYLAQHGIPVHVWGNSWHKNKLSHPNLIIKGRAVCGDDYAKTICSLGIVLGFLCKRNRDVQTQRSMEIPACGAFMLAERTDEHKELFEEGKEAEFFSSNEELLNKIKYYIEHDEERRLIAQAGRERCMKSGYSYQKRLKEILLYIEKHFNKEES